MARRKDSVFGDKVRHNVRGCDMPQSKAVKLTLRFYEKHHLQRSHLRSCPHTTLSFAAAKHLQRTHTVSSHEQEEIVKNTCGMPGIVRTQAEPARVQLPRSAIKPIPELEAASQGRHEASSMFARRSPGTGQCKKHCRRAHGWQNTRRAAVQAGAAAPGGVDQREFTAGVSSTAATPPAGWAGKPRTRTSRGWSGSRRSRHGGSKHEAEVKEAGQALGGWPRRRKARPGRRWWATRRCSRSTARRRAPFDGRMEEDGRERYVEVFGKVLCCIWRTQKRDENEGPAV